MTVSLARALVPLIGGQVCLHACLTGFRMAAPLMALREGNSPAAVGLLLALFALAQVVLALPAGRLADRLGFKRPFVWAVGLATAGALAAVVWPVFGVLCATALACGGASGMALIALQRHVGRLASGGTQLKQVFSWMAIGPSVSNFLGPMVAGLVIDGAGFRAAYAVLAVLPGLAWLCVRRVPEPVWGAAPALQAGETSWQLLRHPPFARLMVVNWLLSSCWDVHTFLVPVLGHERGLSATVIGSLLGGFALAATAIRLLMPLLAARLQESKVVVVAMVSTALLFGLYPWASAVWAMGVLSVLLGAALGSVQPMIMSMLHHITPGHRHGQALALRAMAINASSVAMPLLLGSVGAWVGVAGVFWGVGLCVGAGSRLAATLPLVPGRVEAH